MNRHLRFKFFFIIAVVVVCIYGIIGLPKNAAQLSENFHRNIRLGLDLRGGTYLVVQVQQQDAFNAEASTRADALKEALKKASVQYADVDVVEAHSLQDATHVAIQVKGVPTTQAGAFRSVINEQFATWLLTPVSGTDYRLTMRPSDALKMWQDVLVQTKNTMDKKINALGLSEASVQQRREDQDSQLLVQMPGVDDPGRVKQIIQTAAKLELYDVKGGPYQSREEALAQNNGVLPAGTKLIGSAGAAANGKGGGVYLVARTPVVRGPDIRDARPQQGQMPNTWDTRILAKPGRSAEIRSLYGREYRQPAGDRAGRQGA